MKNYTITLLALLATLIASTSALPTFRLSSRAPVVNIDAVRALTPRHDQPGHGNGTLPTFPILHNGTFVGLAGRNITMLGTDKHHYRSN